MAFCSVIGSNENPNEAASIVGEHSPGTEISHFMISGDGNMLSQWEPAVITRPPASIRMHTAAFYTATKNSSTVYIQILHLNR